MKLTLWQMKNRGNLAIALALVIAVSLGFNNVIFNTSPPLYSSHFVMLTFCTFVYLRTLTRIALRKNFDLDVSMLALFLALAVYSSAGILMAPPRFFSETFKFIFTLYVTYAFILVFRNQKINIILVAVAIVTGTTIAAATFMLNYNILQITADNRLDANRLGGFNVFGFIVANALLVSLFLLKAIHRLPGKILLCSTMPILVSALFLTFSRTAMLAFVIGSGLFLLLSGQKKIFLAASAAFIVMGGYAITSLLHETGLIDVFVSRYFAEDLFSGSGSGRAEIWTNLIFMLVNSPLNLFFGAGLGSIQTEVTGGSTTVNSAHNQFLEYWVSLGVVGILCIVYLMTKVLLIFLRSPSSIEKALFIAVSAQIVIVLFFDSHLQASQASWFFGLWLAMIVGRDKSKEIPLPGRAPSVEL